MLKRFLSVHLPHLMMMTVTAALTAWWKMKHSVFGEDNIHSKYVLQNANRHRHPNEFSEDHFYRLCEVAKQDTISSSDERRVVAAQADPTVVSAVVAAGIKEEAWWFMFLYSLQNGSSQLTLAALFDVPPRILRVSIETSGFIGPTSLSTCQVSLYTSWAREREVELELR